MRRCWLVLLVLLLGAVPWVAASARPRAVAHDATPAAAEGPTVGAAVFDGTEGLRLGENDGLSRLVRTLTGATAPRAPRPGSTLVEPRPPRTRHARRVPPGTADVVQSHRRHGEHLLWPATAPPASR